MKEYLRLEEMSNRRKDKTLLPVNIWIDDSGTYINERHAKRIKFQQNKGDKMGGQPVASMKLDGVVIKTSHYEDGNQLSESDIDEIRNFVINNSYALDKLADEKIKIEDFDSIMIQGGERASDRAIEHQKDLVDILVEEC